MVWHVATFKLDDRSKAQEAADILYTLKDVVPGIVGYTVGVDFVGKANSADVCLVGVFKDKETFEAYMKHPHHTNVVSPAVMGMIGGDYITKTTSCDFLTED